MKLSYPLLVEAFEPQGLFAPEFEICGVRCDSSQRAIEEIIKHEMIHLWLHERGLPSGHTSEFRAKARQMGQPKTRHQIESPKPRSGWEYSCSVCKSTFIRRKRFGRPVACAACCKKFNRGKFDARFKLRGRRIRE
jgi:predicted SprT family Zn-dependent metalloprotease